MDPYFQQSWGQADPSSQVVDERLLIRAEVLDVASGKKHKTGWLDVTKAEQSALLHHLQPARVHLINRRLTTNLNAITYSMSPEQEKVLKKNYVKGTSSVLAKSLYEVGGAPNMIASYLAYDRMTTQFATMYSTAVWGDEITKIQYQVGRKILPPFADRERTAQLKFDYFSFGWRRALPVQEEAQSQFDSYVKK